MTKNDEELHQSKTLDEASWEDAYDNELSDNETINTEPMTQDQYESQYTQDVHVPTAVPTVMPLTLFPKRRQFEEDLTGSLDLETLFSLAEEIKRPIPTQTEMQEAYNTFVLELQELKKRKAEQEEKIRSDMINTLEIFCKNGGIVTGSTVEEHYSSMLHTLKKREDVLLETRRKLGEEKAKALAESTQKKAIARFAVVKPNAKGNQQGVKKVDPKDTRGAKKKARDASFTVVSKEEKIVSQPKAKEEEEEEEEEVPLLIKEDTQISAEPLVLLKVDTLEKVDRTIGFSRPVAKVVPVVSKVDKEEGWSTVSKVPKTAKSVLADPQKQQKVFAKTRFCDSIIEGVKCRHGHNCRFAHTASEIVKRECTFASRCRYVWRTQQGYTNQPCKHTGKICTFWHPAETNENYETRMGIVHKDTKPVNKPIKIVV
jgi:hypothetical protein